MNEVISSFTALPNLHPALVHLPVALLPTAFLFDLAMLPLVRHRQWLEHAAVVLYLAAAAGAAGSYWSGRAAVDGLPPLALEAQRSVGVHSDWAEVTVWLLVLLAVARLTTSRLDREWRRKALRALLLVAAAGTCLIVLRTADLGGELVFEHGVAVALGREAGGGREGEDGPLTPAVGEASGAEGEAAATSLLESADGALSWRPSPLDRGALGTILQPAPGSDLAAVGWSEPTGGLSLTVDGEALLLLPGHCVDVVARAMLDLEAFRGTVGLAHQVSSWDDAGLLTLTFPESELALAVREGGQTRPLARQAVASPEGPFELMVSVSGRHWHGFLDQERLVHGHEDPMGGGGCGLFLSGQGVVRVLSLTIEPGVG